MSLQTQVTLIEAISRLAIARGSKADDVELDVYADGLQDLAPEFVQRACLALGLIPREAYEPALPSVGTIRAKVTEVARQDAEEAARRKLLPMPVIDDDDPHAVRYFCLDCRDEPNAWRVFWCPGRGSEPKAAPQTHAIEAFPCARLKAHPAHSYSERCHCSETNPEIAKARQANARSHASRVMDTVKERASKAAR